jgi:hypothetical protein
MPKFLEMTADKFTFRVATDRLYSPEGVWVLPEPDTTRVRVGLADYLQQHNGDVAFANVKPAGTKLTAGVCFDKIPSVVDSGLTDDGFGCSSWFANWIPHKICWGQRNQTQSRRILTAQNRRSGVTWARASSACGHSPYGPKADSRRLAPLVAVLQTSDPR